jgi:hypothetical protein
MLSESIEKMNMMEQKLLAKCKETKLDSEDAITAKIHNQQR